MAMHLTGRYPENGGRPQIPARDRCMGVGVTGESVRDTTQRLLVGRPGEYGTGMIPAACIVGEPKGPWESPICWIA